MEKKKTRKRGGVPRATLMQRIRFLLFGYEALDWKKTKRKIKKVKKTRRISMGKKCYTNRELSWLRFNERAAAELLEQACALMAQAKSCHDELETYYRTAVDFAQVDAAAAQCMELFGVG